MGDLLDKMLDDRYWLDACKHMLSKDNIDDLDKAEISRLYVEEYRKQFYEEVKEKRFKWGTCNKVMINKIGTTKKRVVYMYDIRDRYILRVMYAVFTDFYRDRLSDNCFSYKPTIRTLDAINYLMSDKDISYKYGLKLDISVYFNSVKEDYLSKVVYEISNGEDEIYKLLSDLLFDKKVIYNDVEIEEYKALIPGTAFSIFLANYVLRELDFYVVNELGLTYARYSDDIIMFSGSKEKLNEALDKIKEKLNETGLKINESKYEWFNPMDDITYLGLKMVGNKVDIGDNTKKKFKKKIKHMCKVGRKLIELEGRDPYKVARDILKRYNYRVFKTYIEDKSKFGWAYYVFRYVNTLESLREIDFYLKDRVRQMITGKNNAGNIKKVSDEKLKELGYVSLCEMYIKFKRDFDLYCDTVDLL